MRFHNVKSGWLKRLILRWLGIDKEELLAEISRLRQEAKERDMKLLHAALNASQEITNIGVKNLKEYFDEILKGLQQ